MIPSQNPKTSNTFGLKDPKIAQKLELIVQQSYNITIPALYFENLSPESIIFDSDNLKNFFSQSGEIIDFITKGKTIIVLYKNFIDAEISMRYLMNDNFYKDNLRNNFAIRWFDYEKDMNIIPPELEIKFEKIHQKNESNIKDNKKKDILNMVHKANGNKLNNGIKGNNINNNNINNNININLNNSTKNNQNIINPNINQNQNINNIFISPNIITQYNQIKMNQRIQMNGMNNLQSNMQQINNYGMQNMVMPPPGNLAMFMNQNLGGMNNIMGMQMNNHQYNINQKQFNQNIEEKNYGKYTCKYEILIPNDKEFQVARRLIGSKGCNMKKILTECKNNNNINDNIKLRLRGRGSGYKEGPQNKESDEPLHLCISAKNQEEIKKACSKVDELLNKIYEEYKKFCQKNNITPVAPQLANRIDCGNSLHKVNNIHN